MSASLRAALAACAALLAGCAGPGGSATSPSSGDVVVPKGDTGQGDGSGGMDGRAAPDPFPSPGCLSNTPCIDDVDCPAGERCNGALKPPGCQRLFCGEADTLCADDVFCAPESKCKDSIPPARCAAASPIGSACQGDEDCQEGLSCAVRTCYSGYHVCSTVGVEGSLCCSLADCPSEFACTSEGVCAAPLAIGENCASTRDCWSLAFDRAYCDFRLDDPVCTRSAAWGDPCSSDADCFVTCQLYGVGVVCERRSCQDGTCGGDVVEEELP